MGTPTPSRRFFMRNIPCLSRTPGSATPIIRSLPKDVFLYEWWLVKAATVSDRDRLHVAGFTSRGKQVMEIFHSAPIVKRHDTVTLESADGITISITGFINRIRTLENGFSKEVCDKFLLGFPYNWEEFATASDRVSPSEANPQFSDTRRSLKYRLPVAFEDLPAVAIQDLLMCIPEDSESSMMNVVVENIRKSYAGSNCTGEKITDPIVAPCNSCTGGKMTDCIKAPCSCTGGKMADCLKGDASEVMKDSSMKRNQTCNIGNTVKHGHTVIHVAPETTSRVEKRVEILQSPEDGITMAATGVREDMNSASEKPLEGSCIDTHASITMAGAGVRGNMNTSSKKCLEGSLFGSYASKTNSKAISGKDGHMGSLVEDSNGNKNEMTGSNGNCKDLPDDYVVPQSCNKSNKINAKLKKRGSPPMSRMRVTRSMKRQRTNPVLDTSAMPDGVTPVVVLDTPKKQSRVPLSGGQVSSARELSKTQNKTEKVEGSHKRTTLRRSSRIQNRKPRVNVFC